MYKYTYAYVCIIYANTFFNKTAVGLILIHPGDWMATKPTPPAAAWINTRSLGFNFAKSPRASRGSFQPQIT